jgi:hypothetical protein
MRIPEREAIMEKKMVSAAMVTALLLVVSLTGTALATSFSNTIMWNMFSGWVWNDEPFTYVHEIPEGTINAASLSIYGELVSDGSILHMSGMWNPSVGRWMWNRNDIDVLNFWNHEILDVTIFADDLPGDPYDLSFHMLSSELTGDYSPACPPEVPEPNTLLLLGAGLVSLAGYGRYRLRRKNN